MKGELSLGEQALDVLRQLVSNKHISLGDLIYQIREREGEGWDGPWVIQWGDAVKNATELLAREDAERKGKEDLARAVAPELLEALRGMVSDRAELNPATIDYARRVIAKAEGKS